MLSTIKIPEHYNYIGVFLTFTCQLKCPYCINHEHGAKPTYATLTGADWVSALNRIQTRPDLPITLQGGEPTLHKDFYHICKCLRSDLPLDLLTNCQFNIDEFCRHVQPTRFKREAPYASIRVSYHPPTMELFDTIHRVKTLQDRGYSVGVWIVDHPKDKLVKWYQKCFQDVGVDCRLKEYLDGGEYGTYKYTDLQGKKNVWCKPSELLIAPNGDMFRCHGDLYGNRTAYGSILREDSVLPDRFVPCKRVACASCDIKLKTNRFQEYGHCAVEIKEKNE